MMEKRGPKAGTPRLRFPEFRGASTWKIRKLSSLADLEKGVQLSSLLKDESAQYPHFNGGISNSSRTADFNRPAHTIIISEGGNSCGFVQFIDEPFWCGGHCYSVTSKQVSAKRFLFFSLQARQKEIMELRVGSGLPNIPKHILERSEVAYSEEAAEQQKIADCLTSLDDVIVAQDRKVEALNAHKRGLMQQLFPREGETLPRLRFPEFRCAPAWRAKGLNKLAKIRTGRKDANEGAVDGVYPFFTCAENHIYSRSYSFDSEAILIAGNANVGQAKYYNGKFEAYQRTYVLTDFSDVFVPYLYQFLDANLRPTLLAQVQTSAMSYIRLPMLEDFQVALPPSIDEQQRIAECFSSLDTQIAAEAEQLTVLKTHKQGLMQQLFPAAEASGA